MKSVLVMGVARGAALAKVAADSACVRLAGIIDLDAARARKVASECRLPAAAVFADLPSAVAACDAQILVVATPNRLHMDHVWQGLDAGLHVLCEKPLTTRRDEAALLHEKSRRSGRQLAVIQNFRYGAHFRRCKEMLAAGAIGTLIRAGIEFHWWRNTAQLGHPHGLLFNHGVHHLDLLRFVTGCTAKQIHALEWDVARDGADEGTGRNFRFTAVAESGAVICYDASYAEVGALLNGRLRLQGTDGTLEAYGDFEAPEVWLTRNARATGAESRQRIEVPGTEWIDIDRLLLEGFARAIETGEPMETDIEDNLQTLNWLFQAAESIEQTARSASVIQDHP